MIRLLIADDHAIVRSGLKQIFALAPDLAVVGEAVNGGEVLERMREEPFDLLLLDLNMPGISGADLIARVKAHRADLPILVLSMHNEPQVAARMLKAGASGYITKDCEPDILLAAIRKVAAHGKYIAPEIAEKMAFDVTSSEPRALHTTLSERELEVMRLLIEGRGVNEIAAQLVISNKTVSTHKARLMEKMQLSSMADMMRYAMEHDLLA
jgi:DNA-binding NarL/FixJ family response regulator